MLGHHVLHRVGGDERKRAASCERYRRLEVALGLRRAGTLQLEIEPPGKKPGPLRCDPLCLFPMILQKSGRDIALHRPGESDEAFGAFSEPGLAQLGAAPELILEPRARE